MAPKVVKPDDEPMKTMLQKHKHIEINGKSVSFNDLINSPLQENWGDDYDRDTLLFIQSWLRGEKVFPITTLYWRKNDAG